MPFIMRKKRGPGAYIIVKEVILNKISAKYVSAKEQTVHGKVYIKVRFSRNLIFQV